jgi:hypothetical protein
MSYPPPLFPFWHPHHLFQSFLLFSFLSLLAAGTYTQVFLCPLVILMALPSSLYHPIMIGGYDI